MRNGIIGAWVTMSLLLLIVAPGVSAQSDDDALCREINGSVIRQTTPSTILNDALRYALYLPPCYDPAGDYPVIYLLHGSNRTEEHWLALGLAETLDRGITGGAFPPVVVAMPFGSWIANENRFAGATTWSNILLTEFIPHIESTTAVHTDRAGRAIGGISRGGFWAYNIAFRFPGQFNAVGGHSAFFDPGHFPADYNPLDLAATAPDLESLRIWLDRGVDDYAFYGLDLMGDALAERGVPHEYMIYPAGEHDDTYWSAHLADYLPFYTADWQSEAATVLPDVAHTFDVSGPVDLYLPAVGFPARRVSVDSARLLRAYAGALDFELILSQRTFIALVESGVPINSETQTVPAEELDAMLWADLDTWTLLPVVDLTPRLRPLMVDNVPVLASDLTRYPFVLPGDGFDPARLTRMLASGVTAMGRRTREAISANGVEWAVSGIRDRVQTADVFHTSNEVSFAPRCPASDEPVLGGLCAVDAHFGVLTGLGVDVVELSGNHNNDYGFTAYERTLDFYVDAGMQTVAGGRDLEAARQPLILTHGENTVAWLSCNWNGPDFAYATADTPGAAPCSTTWFEQALPPLAAQYETVIVSVQYAEYNQYQPIERQMYHFRLVADLGADVVLGTQAHQPQTFEFYRAEDGRDVFIHYGLGNLYFDQTDWPFVRFFMDELWIYDDTLLTVGLYTGIIEDLGRPRWMTQAETTEFLDVMFSVMPE